MTMQMNICLKNKLDFYPKEPKINSHYNLALIMYTKKVYKAVDMAKWTRYETFFFLAIITVVVGLYYFLELNWVRIPWTPLALIGTAVAFVIGFQNNSAYGRIWEARKIWGGIVNTSRTFGMYDTQM